MNLTFDKKKCILLATWLLIGILSFTVVGKYAAAPESHQATIASLDEKKNTVLELTMAATATSAVITLLPGDIGTPIAEKVADLSGYLLIVLCAIFLEKYLVTITGYAAFKIFIPAACVLFATNLFVSNRSLDRLARKLLVFGICIFLVVPSSVKISDLIEHTYQAQIEATLEEAKGTEKLLENNAESEAADHASGSAALDNQTDQSQQITGQSQQTTEISGFWQKAKDALSGAKDSVASAVENVTLSSEELVQKVETSLSHFVEAVAVMLITSCVIPLLVLFVFFWADQDPCGCGSLQREVPERKSIMKYHRIITLKNGLEAGNPDSPIVLVQPVDDHDLEEMEAEVSEIQRLTSMDFCLIAVKVRSWNQDLSPWKAPAVFGNQDFGNGAADFLRNITELCPDPHKTYYLGGYSLAGLFSLWAAYQTSLFAGIAAASPSVWFPGFLDYVKAHKFQSSCVYLSLGDREERTKNSVMAAVGDCIRAYDNWLKEQKIQCTLEWNKGNHFQDPGLRTARAFSWVLTQPPRTL